MSIKVWSKAKTAASPFMSGWRLKTHSSGARTVQPSYLKYNGRTFSERGLMVKRAGDG